MKILITGAGGFVGRNLTEHLKTIRDGRNRTRPKLSIEEILEVHRDTSDEILSRYCREADFVFHLAGVNRPKDPKEFTEGNVHFSEKLMACLEAYENKAPVVVSSSLQATLAGRFGESVYGRSKRDGEERWFDYASRTGAKVLVYRFPNLVGKWVRPEYNSAVGTFCHHIANDLPITVSDPSVEMELLFIDDLLEELLDTLEGKEHHCEFDGVQTILREDGRYCAAPVTHHTTLGQIVDLLHTFRDQPKDLIMPSIPGGSLEKKLYSMYLSYLPREKVAFDLKMNTDERGSFTELLKTADHGQFSVNISKPGITKGEHWHHSKWEFFIVVSGHGLIQERKLGTDEVLEFEVSGEKIRAVHMLPGYTHNIINLSETEDLVTLMWANEIFDPDHPDTFHEKVVPETE